MAGMIRQAARAAAAMAARLRDRSTLDPSVPTPAITRHPDFLCEVARVVDRPGARILELGSRDVTGENRLKPLLKHAEYIGFDYYRGPNVDVVGDAHRLSEHIEGQVDAIYSSAVFEHLAMPWIVAEEIAKVLKIGGILAIETHFSFASHERPWNFFQFSDMGLRALFSPALGFECIEAAMQNPIAGRFTRHASPYLRHQKVVGLYCHSDYYGRKARDVAGFDWRGVSVDEVVGNTRYPAPPGAGA